MSAPPCSRRGRAARAAACLVAGLLCAGLPARPCASAAPGGVAADSNRFVSARTGLSVRKPPRWHFVADLADAESPGQRRFRDADFDSAFRVAPALELVVMLKHPEVYASLNTSFGVTVRPLGDLGALTATELLHIVVAGMEAAGSNGFKIVAPVESLSVAGRPAARSAFLHSVTTSASAEVAVLSRLVFIPRRGVLFVVSGTSPPGSADASDAEFNRILGTLRIDDGPR